MTLRFRCLVVDHDDTSVASTPAIHYPAHVEALRLLRPGREPIGFEGWMRKNFAPGFRHYLEEELGFTREDLEVNNRIWRGFTGSRVPAFFPGFLAILAEYRRRGGLVAVASHSESHMILRDYLADRSLGEPFLPDAVFGWSEDPGLRKPSPYPVQAASERFGLEPGEILVLDDLRPGVEMASAAGAPCAAAGWGHDIPEIRAAMRESCDWYFARVEDFGAFLLDGTAG